MYFTLGGKNWFISSTQIELLDKFLLERLAWRGICRVVNVSLSWLLAYIKKQPDDLNYPLKSLL
jgi:hypothetical protein